MIYNFLPQKSKKSEFFRFNCFFILNSQLYQVFAFLSIADIALDKALFSPTTKQKTARTGSLHPIFML